MTVRQLTWTQMEIVFCDTYHIENSPYLILTLSMAPLLIISMCQEFINTRINIFDADLFSYTYHHFLPWQAGTCPSAFPHSQRTHVQCPDHPTVFLHLMYKPSLSSEYRSFCLFQTTRVCDSLSRKAVMGGLCPPQWRGAEKGARVPHNTPNRSFYRYC